MGLGSTEAAHRRSWRVAPHCAQPAFTFEALQLIAVLDQAKLSLPQLMKYQRSTADMRREACGRCP
jgi:hypothetical protein